MTSPQSEDAEAIEAMAKAAALARGPEPQFLWQEWLVEMQSALSAAKPHIEKALLRWLIGRGAGGWSSSATKPLFHGTTPNER